MAMTARDYFFSVVAPEYAGLSYQAAHQNGIASFIEQSGLPRDECAKVMAKAVNHAACYSNDLLVEMLMKDLISSSSAALRERLSRMFVAKLDDYEANAAALWAEGAYEGDLIFFNVGLSDACFQYATVYCEFARLFGAHSFEASQENREIEVMLAEHVLQLAAAQDRWSRLGKVRLARRDVINSTLEIEKQAAGLVMCACKFILGHEVSHHILGHTEADMYPLAFIEDLPERCKYWNRTEQASHQQEFQADASALTMTLQSPCSGAKAERQREFEAVMGCLLTFTVLGQLVGNVRGISSSHPSVSSRFDQCLEILQATCTQNIRGTILLFKRFQVLLRITQRKGLGCRWRDDVISEWWVRCKERYDKLPTE